MLLLVAAQDPPPASALDVLSMTEAPRFSRSLRRSDARILVTTATRGGAEPSDDDVRRDTRLAADIRALNLFSAVEVGGRAIARWCEPLAKLTVTRSESSKLEQGRWLGSVAKNVFTLGLAESSPPYRETVATRVHLELQRWDGMRKTYAGEGQAIVESDFGEDSAPARRRLMTRVTWQALKQLSLDSAFHWIAADRLQVTKPQAVSAARVAELAQQAAQPFTLPELARIVESEECDGQLCLAREQRASPAGTRSLTRVASPAIGRRVVVAADDPPSLFSPSEVPVAARTLELSNPIAVSEREPLGYCEAVVFHHAKNTRTIYSSCDQRGWLAHTELCRWQVP